MYQVWWVRVECSRRSRQLLSFEFETPHRTLAMSKNNEQFVYHACVLGNGAEFKSEGTLLYIHFSMYIPTVRGCEPTEKAKKRVLAVI